MFIRLQVVLLGLVLCVPMARADVVELSLQADRCAIERALTGQVPGGCETPDLGLVRGISTPKEVGYYVHFPFDSSDLAFAAQQHLTELSQVLNGNLANLCLLIVGHADASGGVAYNQALSLRRATAAQRFLTGPGRVAADRIRVQARGETALLPGLPDTDARHRRVELLARRHAGQACR